MSQGWIVTMHNNELLWGEGCPGPFSIRGELWSHCLGGKEGARMPQLSEPCAADKYEPLVSLPISPAVCSSAKSTRTQKKVHSAAFSSVLDSIGYKFTN